MLIANPSYSTNIKTRVTSYHVSISRISLHKYLIWRMYHVCHLGWLSTKIGKIVDWFEHRLGIDQREFHIPFACRQDMECFHLKDAYEVYLQSFEITEEVYKKLTEKNEN